MILFLLYNSIQFHLYCALRTLHSDVKTLKNATETQQFPLWSEKKSLLRGRNLYQNLSLSMGRHLPRPVGVSGEKLGRWVERRERGERGERGGSRSEGEREIRTSCDSFKADVILFQINQIKTDIFVIPAILHSNPIICIFHSRWFL